MATGQYIGVNGVARKVVSPYVGVDGVARNVKNGYVGVNGVARLFFAPESGAPVILEVEKVTGDTYANDTTYSAEEFILLDIYPKTGGTVKVTYGGLTKTITDTSGADTPNAQEVFFGTLYGVSDSVETPTSGELTISGDYYAFGCGAYIGSKKKLPTYSPFVTSVIELAEITTIPSHAFYNCDKIESVDIPDSVTSIGDSAFYGCENIMVNYIPGSVTSIDKSAFEFSPKICVTTFPEGIVSIGERAFFMEKEDTEHTQMYGAIITLPSTLRSIGAMAFMSSELTDSGGDYRGYISGVNILATTPPAITMESEPPADTNKGLPFSVEGDFRDTFKITVPKGCGNAYKAAEGWRIYTRFIVEAT